MLNFSLGTAQFESCLKTTKLRKVISSRKFIEAGKLERLAESVKNAGAEIIYLEDFAKQIAWTTKLKGVKKYLRRETVKINADKSAAILFTSGSEGLPKAVLLSHRNILANVQQLRLAVPFCSKDVFLNALPMFHSFGLTVGTVLPLLHGVRCACIRRLCTIALYLNWLMICRQRLLLEQTRFYMVTDAWQAPMTFSRYALRLPAVKS